MTCQCGCGERTNPAPFSDRRRGWVRGQPIAYLWGHGSRGRDHPQWRGGTTVTVGGYRLKHRPKHPRAQSGYVREHVLVAEQALGHYLPDGAVVHHVDGDKLNNAPANLVVCADQAYHLLLHKRQRALLGCGDASAVQCIHCRRWFDPQSPHGRGKLNCGCRKDDRSQPPKPCQDCSRPSKPLRRGRCNRCRQRARKRALDFGRNVG